MKKVIGVIVGLALCITVTACGASGISEEDYNAVSAELSSKSEEVSSVSAELSSASAELESVKAVLAEEEKKGKTNKEKIDALEAELESVKTEYSEYKEKMSEYEGLEKAEAEARKIEAASVAAQAEEESRLAAEEEARQKEEKKKAGYETGITYDQLARNPDDYENEKVKFYGRVLQVIQGDTEIQIRLAVDDNYDTVLYAGYDPSIVSSRILEDDMITIYGTSIGLISYESTMGGTITIPAVLVDKIDQ